MTDERKQWRKETIAVQGGYSPCAETGALATPIYHSSAFQFESAEAAADLFMLQREGNVYSRLMNPTNDVFEKRLAMLEGGVAALATSSGQAAVSITLLALCRSGDEVVVSTSLYGGVHNLFKNTLSRLGITARFVDPLDLNAFKEAINENTRAIYAEAMGNPRLDVPDLEAIGKLAHENNLPFVLDNTIPTAMLLQPFEWGVDISVYSTTKYICGHGTTIGGAIVDGGKFDWSSSKSRLMADPDESINNLRYCETFGEAAFIIACRAHVMREIGACQSPMSSFLMLQGLETLPLRMERHCQNAEQVARFLSEHPAVSWVQYPGLSTHETHANAKKYLTGGFSGMVAFGVKEGLSAGRKLVESVKVCKHAANLGDARTLVIHPASTTHSQMPPEYRQKAGIGDDLIRLSVGIENAQDIIEDLDQALS